MALTIVRPRTRFVTAPGCDPSLPPITDAWPHLHRPHSHPMDLAADDAASWPIPDGPVCQISEMLRSSLERRARQHRSVPGGWRFSTGFTCSDAGSSKQSPDNDGTGGGAFSLRSPVRPDPIRTSIVEVVGCNGLVIGVRGFGARRDAAARSPAGLHHCSSR